MARTKRASAGLSLLPFDKKLARLAGAVVGSDDPGGFEWIPAKFGQFSTFPAKN
jgi:hypothetical protein